MKTISQLQKEKADIKHSIENDDMKPSVERKLRKRIPFLNHCIMYLESNPKESFIKSEIQKVEDKITIRMSYFVLNNVDEMPKSEVSRMRRAHEKTYDIKKLREQVRTLRFLLK